jgi:hypothetical protein
MKFLHTPTPRLPTFDMDFSQHNSSLNRFIAVGVDYNLGVVIMRVHSRIVSQPFLDLHFVALFGRPSIIFEIQSLLFGLSQATHASDRHQ